MFQENKIWNVKDINKIGRSVDKILGCADITSKNELNKILSLNREVSKREIKEVQKILRLKKEEKVRRKVKKGEIESKRNLIKVEKGYLFYSDYASMFISEKDFKYLRNKGITAKDRMIKLLDMAKRQNSFLSKWDIIGILDIAEITYWKIEKSDIGIKHFRFSTNEKFRNGKYFTGDKLCDFWIFENGKYKLKRKNYEVKNLANSNTKILYQREHRYLKEKFDL